jgi:hypothetical protein
MSARDKAAKHRIRERALRKKATKSLFSTGELLTPKKRTVLTKQAIRQRKKAERAENKSG